jgi:hypothetical protein
MGFWVNNPLTGASEFDANGTGDNLVLDVNKANAKALGLVANDLTTDASRRQTSQPLQGQP